MKLTSTEQKLLELLQTGHTREDIVLATGGHPIYLAKVLKAMTDRGLLEATIRPAVPRRTVWRAKVKLALVPIDTASLTDGAQGTA